MARPEEHPLFIGFPPFNLLRKITFSGVVCLPDEAFSTQRSSIGRLRRLREPEIVRQMPTKAGSRPALHCIRLDLSITTTVRHFLHWPHHALGWTRSHADRC